MIDSLYQLIAKTGFTDPLHAPITHIPIGLVIGAFLFFLVAVVFSKKNLVTTARHVSILAFIFVFPTILFGVFDWLHFFKGVLIQPIKMKMILASCVLVLLAVGITLGGNVKLFAGPMLVIYGLAFVAVVGLGWYGARLVYGGFSGSAAQAAPAAQQTGQAAQAGQPAQTGQAAGKTGGAATASAVASGQRLYNDNCSACHPNGTNIVVAQLPLKTSKKLVDLTTFTGFIRAPKMPDGTEGGMPAFTPDLISDPQAGDLFAYINSMLSAWK
jgi:mono/diheme cytochrome c family protein